MTRKALMVLLVLNGLTQLVGGSTMIFAPAKFADAMFHVAVNADAERLMAIIGAASFSYLILTVASLVWLAQRRRVGCDLAALQGVMLVLLAVVMIVTGASLAAGVDVIKGGAITALGLWARRSEDLG
jgi:hypothetical protein